MDLKDFTVNGMGIIDSDVARELQQDLQKISVSLNDASIEDVAGKKRDEVLARGEEVLERLSVPSVFLMQVKDFSDGSNVPEGETGEEVLLVGLHVAQLTPAYLHCGLVLYGRNLKADVLDGEVVMETLCHSESTLCDFFLPKGSKVFELLFRDGNVSAVVTCPAEIDTFYIKVASFIDCIKPEDRFFPPE